MFESPGSVVSVGLLLITLVCFGSWSALRKLSGLPFPQFAFLSLSTQLFFAVFWFATLGHLGGSSVQESDLSISSLGDIFDDRLQSCAVLLGGFLLGHSDMIGSWSMQFLPAGVSFALYACTSLVLSTLLNLAIQGSSHVVLLFLGIVLTLLGKLFLSISASLNAKSGSQGGQDLSMDQAQSTAIDSPLHVAPILRKEPRKLTQRQAMLVAVVAGCICSLWSPLSTFARTSGSRRAAVKNPYICLGLFALGEFVALPTLLAFARGVIRQPLVMCIARQDAAWAVLSGAAVSTGYIFYFLASSNVPSAIAFGIGGGSAPLMALFLDVIRGEYRGSSLYSKVFLILGVCSLLCAVVTLALIA